MRNGKYNKSNKGSRAIVLLMALMLLVGSAIGGTLAWLISTTEKVTDVFTYGDVSIKLTEGENADKLWLNSEHKTKAALDNLIVIPGDTNPYNPYVMIEGGSEPCYVFVEVVPTIAAGLNFDDYVKKSVDGNWTALGTGYENIYYKAFENGVAVNTFIPVIDKNQISFPDTVTREMLDKFEDANGDVDDDKLPKLLITAYAIQKDYLTNNGTAVTTPEGAWELAGFGKSNP